MDKAPLWTKNFINVSITNFLVFTAFYYLLVTMPIYAMQELHGHESAAGLITASFLISAIVTRPLAGKWIERAGKQTVFRPALFILGGCSVFYFIPHSVAAMIVLRFFHGIGFGMATTAAGAIVADLLPESRRGEGMGYYGLTMNLAMAIGPFVGLTILQQGGPTAMLVVHAAAALIALLAGLSVKLPKAAQTAAHPQTDKLPVGTGLKGLFARSAIPVSLVAAYFALAYSAIISFVSVYAKEIGLAKTASYFFIVYALILLASRPFSGRWFDRFGAHVIIYPALVLFAIGTFWLSTAGTAWSFLLSAALIGLGWGTVFPSLQTIAIQLAPPGKSALATATFLSIFDFGFGVGSFLFGFIAPAVGHASLYFYISLLVAAGIGVYYLLHRRMSEPSVAADGDPR